jgi:hypothetical protein
MLRGTAALAALLLFVAPAVAESQYAPAGITVSQLFERNRHSAGTFENGAYHLVTRTTSPDGDVWTAETFWYGRDYRTTIGEAGFRWSYGEYRDRNWHEDPNGLVMPSSGLFEEVDPFVAALRKAQDPQSAVKLLGMTAGSSPAFVVDVTPAGGLSERRYYDVGTYLLGRVEMTDYDGHKQVWIYGDYRPVSGRMIAHLIDYQRDAGTITLETKLTTYERVSASALDLALPSSKPVFDLRGRDAVAIPARFDDAGIIVPVSVGARGLDFLLDSGSSELLIDPQIARELGMSSSGAMGESFGGDFSIANARAADLSVGSLTARNVVFSTAAFQEELPGQRVVGLLGTDFIGSGALKVDFEKKTLTLLRVLPPGLSAAGWSALPLRLDYGVPLVKATFSGLDGYFVADLGADYSMLFPHYFSKFPNNIPRGMPDQGEMETIGGKPFGIKHITMKRLVLGDWVFGDVQVVVPSAQYAQDRDYDGLIGRDTLSNFDIIFDYNDGQLWFKPIDLK